MKTMRGGERLSTKLDDDDVFRESLERMIERVPAGATEAAS